MQHYRKTSHAVYDIKSHLVWITKYRKPVLAGAVAIRLRDLIREICKSMDVEIVKGHVSKDHLHILVSAPPHLSVSKLVQHLKGKTSRKLLSEYRRLAQQFWGRHLWARGYFVASSGNVTDDIIAQYIEMQDKMEHTRDDDFSIGDNA
jgi:putative transposase